MTAPDERTRPRYKLCRDCADKLFADAPEALKRFGVAVLIEWFASQYDMPREFAQHWLARTAIEFNIELDEMLAAVNYLEELYKKRRDATHEHQGAPH